MLFVLKMTKKYTLNMTLRSRYKGQLLGERSANKFGQGPPSGQCRKEVFPNLIFFIIAVARI